MAMRRWYKDDEASAVIREAIKGPGTECVKGAKCDGETNVPRG